MDQPVNQRLADLDRPAVTIPYEPWDQDVTLRPISGRDLIDLQGEFSIVEGMSVDNADALAFYAALLAACVESHRFTAEEWAAQATQKTLITLGLHALEISNLKAEDTKKN